SCPDPIGRIRWRRIAAVRRWPFGNTPFRVGRNFRRGIGGFYSLPRLRHLILAPPLSIRTHFVERRLRFSFQLSAFSFSLCGSLSCPPSAFGYQLCGVGVWVLSVVSPRETISCQLPGHRISPNLHTPSR